MLRGVVHNNTERRDMRIKIARYKNKELCNTYEYKSAKDSKARYRIILHSMVWYRAGLEFGRVGRTDLSDLGA